MRALPLLALALLSCSLAAPDDAALTGGAARCAPGRVWCGGACVSRLDPAYGCGACAPCALEHGRAVCDGKGCALAACEPGFDDCDGDAANGCETALSAATSCGRCGLGCGEPTPRCEASICVPRCGAIDLTTRSAQVEAPSTGWDVGTSDLTLETWVQVHGRFGALAAGRLLGQPRGLQVNVRVGARAEVGLVLTQDDGAPTPTAEHWVAFPADDAWHHLAWVRTGATITAWLDGQPAGSSTGGVVALTTRAATFLGAWSAGEAQPVRIGPTRLSRVARYGAPFTPRTYFRVDEATVTQWLSTRPLDKRVHDEAGGDNDGAVVRDVVAATQAPCGP